MNPSHAIGLLIVFSWCFGPPFLLIGLAFRIYEKATGKPPERRHSGGILLAGAIFSIHLLTLLTIACLSRLFGW